MGLPWVRMDTSLPGHDKVLDLIDQRGRVKALQALCVYQFGIEYAAAHGTDGLIKRSGLRAIHATTAEADMLVSVQLWDPDPDGVGWWIHNYARRNQSAETSEDIQERTARAGRASGCARKGHPKGCRCWEDPPVKLVQRAEG